MPRYLVQRTFLDGFPIGTAPDPAAACLAVVERNSAEGVTWIQSYVSEDGKRAFCIYEASSPEAVRTTARRNGLPVDHITQVRILDPYFY